MKGIAALIKIGKHELDQKRRALRQLEDVRAGFEQALEDLKAEVAAEQRAAGGSVEGNYTYGGYARRVIGRREELQRRLREVTKQVEAARDDVARSFEELKKYEITKTARDDAEAAEMRRKEGILLDELGIGAFARARKD